MGSRQILVLCSFQLHYCSLCAGKTIALLLPCDPCRSRGTYLPSRTKGVDKLHIISSIHHHDPSHAKRPTPSDGYSPLYCSCNDIQTKPPVDFVAASTMFGWGKKKVQAPEPEKPVVPRLDLSQVICMEERRASTRGRV